MSHYIQVCFCLHRMRQVFMFFVGFMVTTLGSGGWGEGYSEVSCNLESHHSPQSHFNASVSTVHGNKGGALPGVKPNKSGLRFHCEASHILRVKGENSPPSYASKQECVQFDNSACNISPLKSRRLYETVEQCCKRKKPQGRLCLCPLNPSTRLFISVHHWNSKWVWMFFCPLFSKLRINNCIALQMTSPR